MDTSTLQVVEWSGRADLSERPDFFLSLLDDTHAWRERLVEELTFGSGSHVRVTSGYQIDFPPALLEKHLDGSNADARSLNVLLPLTARPKRPLLNVDLGGPGQTPAALVSRASTAALESLYLRRLVETSPVADEIAERFEDRLFEAICVFSPALFEDHFLVTSRGGYEDALRDYLEDGLGFGIRRDALARWRIRTKRAGAVLAARLGEMPDSTSSSEEVLLALPRMDPRPSSEAQIDDVVWDFQQGVMSAHRADDGDFLVALAEYGRRYEVVVEVELPTLEPRSIKLSEDRPLEVDWIGRTTQRFALGDARSAHLEARVSDPNVQIAAFDVVDINHRPTRLGWIEAARRTSETVSIYSSEAGRPFYVDVKLRLQAEPHILLTSVVLVALNALAFVALVLAPDDGSYVERVALLVVPTTLAAAFALVREQTTLASRLLVLPRLLIGLSTIALWIVAVFGVSSYDADRHQARSGGAKKASVGIVRDGLE